MGYNISYFAHKLPNRKALTMNIQLSITAVPFERPIPNIPSQWVSVWENLPTEGIIVPVWDGDYIYYASYWDRQGYQFWIVADSISPSTEDRNMMKCSGEQVYPIHWLNITEPNK